MQNNLMKFGSASILQRLLLLFLVAVLAALHGYSIVSRPLWLAANLISGLLLGLSLQAWHLTIPSPSTPSSDRFRALIVAFIEFCRFITLMEWASLLLIPLGLVRLYIHSLDLSLNHFEDRTLGIAVMEGIDVAARSKGAITSIAIGMGILMLILICLFLINAGWQISSQQKQNVRQSLQPAHYLSMILIAIYALVGDYALESRYLLLIQWIIVFLALYPMMRFSVRIHPALLNALVGAILFSTLSILAYLGKLSPVTTEHFPILLWASVVIGITIIPILIARSSGSIPDYRGQIGDYIYLQASLEGDAAGQAPNLRINYEAQLDEDLLNNWLKFRLVSDASNYMVRMSTQYAWVGHLIESISVTNESGLPITIMGFEIRRSRE